jgi:hypothetical protein
MEEVPEIGKESLHPAHANGIHEWMDGMNSIKSENITIFILFNLCLFS